jgi:hypothetical protein
MPTIDKDGSLIRVSSDGLAKLDGIPMFRVIVRDGGIYLEFCDRDRLRSSCRGSRFVEIPLKSMVAVISAANEAKTE